ncbi:transmembrane protein 135, partial [Biomphalaria glabrata]
ALETGYRMLVERQLITPVHNGEVSQPECYFLETTSLTSRYKTYCTYTHNL